MARTANHSKPKNMKYASDVIARGLNDIANGQTSGDFPTLESIFNRQGRLDHDICTPECVNRIRGQQENGLITDIIAPSGERLAVVEHRIGELKENFDNHRIESIRAGANFATKEELAVVDKHVDKLDTQSTLKTVALLFTVVGFLISMTYNVINIYRSLHL